MNKFPFLLPAIAGFALGAQAQSTPNIVIIFADDLGYGDLSCFGAKDINTPNLDRIANEGIRFTEFYSASPVSSPSRAGLLTGRLPQRMGIHGVFFPDSHTGMPPQEVTIAEMLKSKGYATGIVGKWHLGHLEKFMPWSQGFDYYFGIPYSNDMASVVYYENKEVVDFNVDQHYTTRTYTQKAVNYIKDNAKQPFFLYLAHNMPHVPIYASPEFENKSKRGLYGDVIQEIDWSVGQVYKTLDSLGILDNTLVLFTSDNGPWLPFFEQAGSAGVLREGKQYTFEGGMRVPCVAMWPNVIKKGTVHGDLASTLDLFPTIAQYVGYNTDTQKLDGVSIQNVIEGKGKRSKRDYLYYEGADLQAYRYDEWKLKLPYNGHKGSKGRKPVAAHELLLFNLKDDPGETRNLAAEYPEKVAEMQTAMKKAAEQLGELPSSLILRTPADGIHYEIQKKNHPEYLEQISK